MFLAAGVVYGDNLADNPLVPLMDGETHKWSLEVSGMFPQPSEGSAFNRRSLMDDNIARSFTINAGGSGEPVKSYLYLLVSDYYQPSMTWTVTFNGNVLAASEHSDSIGGSAKGDGRLDHERQTVFFDVTGMVSTGANTLTITDVYATQRYFFDGAVLLNFYPSDEEHQYWVYHGVEYLERVDVNEATYEQTFSGASYPAGSEAVLYTVYQNREQVHDALYFNDNLLKDKDATYLLNGSEMTAKTFSVSKYLNNADKVTFDMERYQTDEGAPFIQYTDNPIYPSLAILDVKLPPKPKVVVLANSIDYNLSSDFFGSLEDKGLEVIHVTADDFEQYKTQRFIVILGGPDAPEGVGEIVRGSNILKIDNVDYIREKGHKAKYDGTNPWGNLIGQRVWLLAGSDREQTKQAHIAHRNVIADEILSLAAPSAEEPAEPVDPCPPDENNPINHTLGFESVEARGDVYICQVVYSEGSNNWQIKLYNQGEEDVSLKRYKISGTGDKSYQFNAYVNTNIIKSGGYYTLYSGELSTSTLRLGNKKGYLALMDSSKDLIDKVEWDLLS